MRAEIRAGLGISDERFVISFVGRHNRVKGYDRLIEVFGKLKNVTVICCGKEGLISAPVSKNWIEIGWTDDPFSYVNASDLFILPNRETYFDLALLETLSFGKVSLLSETGGNKLVSGMEDIGIYSFETEDEAADIIRSVMNEDPSERKKKEERQVLLHQEKYSMEKFCEGYREILRKVCGK